MQILEKIRRLATDGQYDLCCDGSSNYVKADNNLLNAAKDGIYYSETQAGVCKLFKTLMDSSCSYDCKYCKNSTKCSKKKTAKYTPEELAKVFNTLRKYDYVHGLFLSSGIPKEADDAMQNMIEAVKIIRLKQKFKGYIHLKALPGTSKHLIQEGAKYADRMSINLEAPSKSRLNEFSDIKDFNKDILLRQKWINEQNPRAGQTTQIIVGANDATDLEVLKTVDWEYQNMNLFKAYFSGFKPVEHTPLQNQPKENMTRVRHLYNTDFLLRKYDYKFKEFKEIMDNGMLPNQDPKLALALENFDKPIDVNQASFKELIRTPGIGITSANRIIRERNKKKITKFEQLKNFGARINNVKPFVKMNGYSQKMLNAFC